MIDNLLNDYQQVPKTTVRIRGQPDVIPDLEPKKQDEVFVLLKSRENDVGGVDWVLPWWNVVLRSVKSEIAQPEPFDPYSRFGKRVLRVMSAAMVAHYYLAKDPGLSMASVGTQLYHMWFPVLAAYSAGVYVAPVGFALYGLSCLGLR